MPVPGDGGPSPGAAPETASMKPPPLLSRRRFKGSIGTAKTGREQNFENKDPKFEKHDLEQLIKDQAAQLERLSGSLRAQSVELSKLRRLNSSMSHDILENINNTLYKALRNERRKHEDERIRQDAALQEIKQLEKVTLAVLEQEVTRVRCVKLSPSRDATKQDDIPIALGENLI